MVLRPHHPLRTPCILLAGLLILFPLAGRAAESGARHHPREPRLAAVDLISAIFPPLGALLEKAGCEIDPDGRCRASMVSHPRVAGCEIDPNGRCLGGH